MDPEKVCLEDMRTGSQDCEVRLGLYGFDRGRLYGANPCYQRQGGTSSAQAPVQASSPSSTPGITSANVNQPNTITLDPLDADPFNMALGRYRRRFLRDYFYPRGGFYPRGVFSPRRVADGGEIIGPGTPTSDSIPALLSDGEFVMNARAVRGAGGGDRAVGAKRMYRMMRELEQRA